VLNYAKLHAVISKQHYFIYTAHTKAKDNKAKTMDAKATKFGLKAKALISLVTGSLSNIRCSSSNSNPPAEVKQKFNLHSFLSHVLDCFCNLPHFGIGEETELLSQS